MAIGNAEIVNLLVENRIRKLELEIEELEAQADKEVAIQLQLYGEWRVEAKEKLNARYLTQLRAIAQAAMAMYLPEFKYPWDVSLNSAQLDVELAGVNIAGSNSGFYRQAYGASWFDCYVNVTSPDPLGEAVLEAEEDGPLMNLIGAIEIRVQGLDKGHPLYPELAESRARLVANDKARNEKRKQIENRDRLTSKSLAYITSEQIANGADMSVDVKNLINRLEGATLFIE